MIMKLLLLLPVVTLRTMMVTKILVLLSLDVEVVIVIDIVI